MSVVITFPAAGASLPTGETVLIAGTADQGVARVRLAADGLFDLGEVPVSGGNWKLPRDFSKPGRRTIIATGLGSDGAPAGGRDEITFLLDTPATTCEFKRGLFKIGSRMVFHLPGHTTFFYRAGMSIDADGSPRAYHPDDIGLDDLANAMRGGQLFGLAVDDNGQPFVQGASDPCPGFFVSTTALEDAALPRRDPNRYVDSETVPYFVLPGASAMRETGVRLGDFGVVFNGRNGKFCSAVYADIGSARNLGEGSIALAEALGVPSSPRLGGVEAGLLYVVFPGSRAALGRNWTHRETRADIEAGAAPHFAAWGGAGRIRACFSEFA